MNTISSQPRAFILRFVRASVVLVTSASGHRRCRRHRQRPRSPLHPRHRHPHPHHNTGEIKITIASRRHKGQLKSIV